MSVPQQALAPLQHGGRSSVALAPAMRATKRELCRRYGIRYQDLDASGKVAIDLFARVQTKLIAIDRYLESHPVVNEQGEPAACLPIYAQLVNSASRLHGRVLEVLQAQRAEDDALQRHLDEHYGGDE